jgi:Protein of unknown function (DUF4238)
MAQGRSRDHHYISRAFLRRFAFSKQKDANAAEVWVRRRGQDPSPQSVASVAYERDLRTVPDESGEPSDWLEHHLGELEGWANEVLDRLCADQTALSSLTWTERAMVGQYAGLLRYGTPGALDAIVLEARDSPAGGAALDRMRGAATGDPGDRGVVTMLLTVQSIRLGEELARRPWEVRRVVAGEGPTLVLGDQPVLVYDLPADDGPTLKLWVLSICPWAVLVLHARGGAAVAGEPLTPEQVLSLNRRSWRLTERFAVAKTERDLDLTRLEGDDALPVGIDRA